MVYFEILELCSTTMSAPMLGDGMNISCTATSASTSTICTFCCHYGHVEAECFRRAEWVQHYAKVAQQKKQTKTRRGKAKRATVASNAPHTDGSDTGSFSARLENTSLSPTSAKLHSGHRTLRPAIHHCNPTRAGRIFRAPYGHL